MLMTIGQISKTGSVSVKTLRYYDSIGLLKPAYVDKFTGYRYYNEAQLDTLLIISRLKRYGFSLAEISEFLTSENKEVLLYKLKAQYVSINAEITHKQMLAYELKDIIDNFERTGEIMNHSGYDIKAVKNDTMYILSSRQNMSVEDFGKYYGILFSKIARENIETTGKVLAIYHDKGFDENNSDIEVGISVKDKNKATRILEGGLCARTVHKGSYAALPEAYAAVIKWINENNYKIAAPPFEIYRISHVDNVAADKWETDIYFPIKR